VASTNAMLKQCSGLIDTKDVTDWENSFLKSVWERSQHGTRPDQLTDRQVTALESIHEKHFG
jgi:hypothetical protein